MAAPGTISPTTLSSSPIRPPRSECQLRKNVHDNATTACDDTNRKALSFSREKLPRASSGETASSSLKLPIIYCYLTFETRLPSPCQTGSLLPGENSPPNPPDLRDYASPFTWAESRKRIITWLSCAVTISTAYSAGAYSPATGQLSEYWGVSQLATYLGLTTFTTGFAIAPMVLAPFSEINGRYPVFVVSGALFVASQLFCAISRSLPGMLVARFFLGVGGSTFSTMVGGVVSDMYHTADRNLPMTLFAGKSLGGSHRLWEHTC